MNSFLLRSIANREGTLSMKKQPDKGCFLLPGSGYVGSVIGFKIESDDSRLVPNFRKRLFQLVQKTRQYNRTVLFIYLVQIQQVIAICNQ
ncbi:hypothetical protein D3C79_36090 [compost metagenome]